jgi:type I restriction enzyme S subunit
MGGGTIFHSVTTKDLKEIRLLQPPPELCERLSSFIDPTFQLIKRLTNSNRNLSEIRDLLLSRLVSGDLDVSDLDLGLEAVS